MKNRFAQCALSALILAAGPAAARLTEINVTAVEPFAEGALFGNAGAYERVKGTFKGELDPADPRNKAIVNIDKAARNAAGRIEYEADFYILRPVDAARGSRKILYDVTNRGRQYAHWMFGDSRTVRNDPRAAEDAGNALILRRGYVIVWSGWDPDAPRSNAGLSMKPVIALNGGAPIVRVIREELQNGTRGPLRDTFRLTHEAATQDPSQSRLSVRRGEADPREPIPAEGWAHVNSREIRLLPQGTRPAAGSPRPATSSRSCAMRRRIQRATPIPPAPASGTPWRSAARRAGATCATTSRRASTRTSPRARCSTACLHTPQGSAAYSSTPSSASPRAPIPSTRTAPFQRMHFRSLPRA